MTMWWWMMMWCIEFWLWTWDLGLWSLDIEVWIFEVMNFLNFYFLTFILRRTTTGAAF
jgi:hypothetical protein